MLTDAKGNKVVSGSIAGAGKKNAVLEVASPMKWTAETPYLYTLTATVKSGDKVVEVIPVKVGFRKIEIRDAQVLVNGRRVLIKGANRHEMHPDRGYYLLREDMIRDIQIMKQAQYQRRAYLPLSRRPDVV